MGGYKIQGQNPNEEETILKEARVLQEAGAFAILMEGVLLEVAQKVTEQSSLPTIGISSGPHCDGQVLVLYDILGLDPGFQPKFVKKYLDLHSLALKALNQYKTEVQQGRFPTLEHAFSKKGKGI